MALELWEVEVRSRATLDQLRRVAVDEQREVEERARNRLPVDDHVLLREVKAPWPHQKRRG